MESLEYLMLLKPSPSKRSLTGTKHPETTALLQREQYSAGPDNAPPLPVVIENSNSNSKDYDP